MDTLGTSMEILAISNAQKPFGPENTIKSFLGFISVILHKPYSLSSHFANFFFNII